MPNYMHHMSAPLLSRRLHLVKSGGSKSDKVSERGGTWPAVGTNLQIGATLKWVTPSE